MPKIFLILISFIFCNPAFALEETPYSVDVDGWELKGDLVVPSNPKAFVFLFHKIGGERQIYKDLAKKFSEKGVASLRLDLRAHGESTNLESYDHSNQYNISILDETYKDIIEAQRKIMDDLRFKGLPFGVIGASYSGKYAILAAEEIGYPKAFIQLAPGSLTRRTIQLVEPSGVPFLFVRTKIEMDFFDELFKVIGDMAPSAEQWIIPGAGHASDMLEGRLGLQDRLVNWMTQHLFDRYSKN